jgi:glycosyltransferase involved in cell wall biosynthesis
MGNPGSQKKIKVAWFASGFVGRYASGTAQTAKKIITNLINSHSSEVQVVLIAKNLDEVQLIKKEQLFSSVEIILLPKVYGKKFRSSRQFYKFCVFGRKLDVDILHYSVPRVYPFFWMFPAKKIVCTFHAGGDVTAPRDYFVLSREIYNYIIKKQWNKFTAIVADSKFAANEIELAYHIPLEFIKIIYLGSDNLWEQITETVEKDLNSVVVIGRWQRYKNLHTIISSFKKFEIKL